jgi:hypothetical protein
MITCMPFWSKREPEPTEVDLGEIQRYEIGALKRYFANQSALANGDLWAPVEQLVLARSPREVISAIEANPVLLTDRGDAALQLTAIYAEMVNLSWSLAVVADRRAWLERMRDVRPDA